VSLSEIEKLDEALSVWRQGDAILEGAPPFIFLSDLRTPLSAPAQEQAKGRSIEIDIVDVPGPGLAVVSQTCDLVRTCKERPYAEVCPLVPLPSEVLDQVLRGRRPQYFVLSGLAAANLAVDLDRTMTVEKTILIPFTDNRVRGVRTEEEAREFANAAARKRNRAALPDAFVSGLEAIRQRIVDKHGKNSPEGRFLSDVRDLRVRADPSWSAEAAHVEMLFVYERLGDIPPSADEHIAKFVARFLPSGPYLSLSGRAVSLDTLPAADYVASDRLDLEHLSTKGADATSK
jgi:hypothetical protein